MAQFCIEIADDDVERVISSLCATYGRSGQVDNPNFDPSEPAGPENTMMIDNPETPNEFANRVVRQFIEEVTVAHEFKVAKDNVSMPSSPNIGPAE